MTRDEALKLSGKELDQRLNELCKLLEVGAVDADWDKNYDEYNMLSDIYEERYPERNIDAFEKFFFTKIHGKEWSEIDSEALDLYSDWHKDMKTIEVNYMPGDVCWVRGQYRECIIDQVIIQEDDIIYTWCNYDHGPDLTELWDDGEFNAEDIGKTVFDSLEDYEKAFPEDFDFL